MRTTLLCVVFLSTATARTSDDPIPNFTNVQLWTCNGGFRQQWEIIQKGPPNDHIQLKFDGKVLDILGYSNDTGANVQVEDAASQKTNVVDLYSCRSLAQQTRRGMSSSPTIQQTGKLSAS